VKIIRNSAEIKPSEIISGGFLKILIVVIWEDGTSFHIASELKNRGFLFISILDSEYCIE